MDGPSRTIIPACVQSRRAQASKEKRPARFKPYYKTLLSENLGTHCHEQPAGRGGGGGGGGQTMQKYNQGFPTRMVYLYYISCLRYTILVGYPRNLCLSKPTASHMTSCSTQTALSQGTGLGWGFTIKQGGRTVHEDSGAHRVTTSSLPMEVEAVTHAIQWLTSQRGAQITHAIILRLNELPAKSGV